MKVTSNGMIDKVNNVLIEYKQTILVVRWTSVEIEFTNGTVLAGNDREKFIKRIFNKKTDLWKSNSDELLNKSKTENEIKSILASYGGKKVQELHGEKIKKNLNVGIPWNKNMKGNYPHHYPCTNYAKMLISNANAGEKNGRYGYIYSEEEKNVKSKLMKNKILKGEFTPNSNNRNTHWESFYNGMNYRSSWEALYQYFNPNAEYEKLRIRYVSDDVEKVYIVDFIDYVDNLVIEVKPKKFFSSDSVIQKLNALTEWSVTNSFNVLLVTEDWFINYPINTIDFAKFDENTQRKIRKFYETYKKG